MSISPDSLFSIDDDSSVDSSYSSSYSTTISRLTAVKQQSNDDESLATQESKDLVKFRGVFITILFWTTIGVSMYIWVYFSEEIELAFEEEFVDNAEAAYTAVASKFLLAIGAIDSFAITLSTQFSDWPFVTIPKFERQAEQLRKLSCAVKVTNYIHVENNQIQKWNEYAASNSNDFLTKDSIDNEQNSPTLQRNSLLGNGVSDIEFTNSSFMPSWQQYPITNSTRFGFNGFQYKALADAYETFKNDSNSHSISYMNNIETTLDPELNITERNDPFADIFVPITNVDENEAGFRVVGVVSITFYWGDMLKNMLTDKVGAGMYIVFENTCNQTSTYMWNGTAPEYIGDGDHHETAFEESEVSYTLPESNGCQYSMHLYPSESSFVEFKDSQPNPGTFAGIAITIFIFTSLVFIFYDCLVERRQRKVYSSAVKNNAIVSSLFPKNVRDRLYKENSNRPRSFRPAKTRLKSLIDDDNANDTSGTENEADSPIADLFSNCTVLFADISGFTSWSSERSPGQVFVLLENIYGAFDRIADRRGVFKVETIGDCYMAVTGLPNPIKDHAVVMARFARDCRDELNALTRSLEVSLGPETSDLTMRFGLHSGPVTAGVLRGQKSRFQLFGDTVNTASRMEHTGICNRIHISEETAKLLIEAGKSNWLTPRTETVQAKGKGELTTYWLFDKQFKQRGSTCASTVMSETSIRVNATSPQPVMTDRRGRLIDWNVDLFAGLIRKIVARRQAQRSTLNSKEKVVKIGDEITINIAKDGMVLDEVVEIIELPAFDPKVVALQADPHSIQLDAAVLVELREYIFTISTLYRENSFHNFEHASHVTMSVAKLLSRIVAPDLEITSSQCNATLHDHTYGITSDPLTQFACILAALIHDVDHQGVPNTRLVEEEDSVAIKYNGRSVAEQNSVDIAWALFLEPQFSELRGAVCSTDKELDRLRQLIVNTVLATDIMDKDLKQLRNQRWEKAFSFDMIDNNETNHDKVNRKATIVLEHLIQASDVCHTMQHWHVYRKWNERLFEEMYVAYKIGRAKADPSTFWYKGELGFFDHYIIPLSKKLSDCGVFGVSSDEYLNYALRNRKEWEQRGHAIVAEMIERIQNKNGDV